jgi:hypothetical protein
LVSQIGGYEISSNMSASATANKIMRANRIGNFAIVDWRLGNIPYVDSNTYVKPLAEKVTKNVSWRRQSIYSRRETPTNEQL